MDIRAATLIKITALIVLMMLISMLSFTPRQEVEAQRSDDSRFGLVNAYDASQAAYQLGASWEVVIIHWDQIQPASPTQWVTIPEIENGLAAARTASREVVGVLIGTPAWATDGQPGTGVPRGLYLPMNDPGNVWAAFVKQAVGYFAARGVNRWAIWRNPDIPPGGRGSQWDGSISDYYQLVKVAYLAAHSANPNAVIHLGGTGSYDPGWFSRYLDVVLSDLTAPTNNYYFDVATLHVYYSVDEIYTLMQNAFFVMDRKGIPLKEVWLNETNARPALDPAVYPSDQAFLRYSKVTMEQQAAFIVQAYAVGFAANRGARIAVYRLVDNLEADGKEAFGLLRADGSRRPAYDAYRLVTEQFSEFVYARRVSEETHPLIDYVRLTFENKVTHVAWARTAQTATLIIPARSQQATLIDLQGNRWPVTPQDGEYRVVVGGADCNDPMEGCLIGGAPWLLVEEGVEEALTTTPPSVKVERGGVLPTPDPALAMTATALAAPSPTPTVPTATPTATLTPLPSSTPTVPTATPTRPPTRTPAPVNTSRPTTTMTSLPAATVTSAEMEVAEATVQPPWEATLQAAEAVEIDESALRPRGLTAAVPYVLIGLGTIAIGAGVWYFASALWLERKRQQPPPDEEADQSADEVNQAPEDDQDQV